MIEKAQKFIQKGNLDKALAEYRAVAAIDPNDITIGLRIGELCVKTGQKEAARARRHTPDWLSQLSKTDPGVTTMSCRRCGAGCWHPLARKTIRTRVI